MQISLRFVLMIMILIYLIILITSVKHKKMRMNYLIFWTIVGIAMIIALLIPDVIKDFSRFIGFEVPINMIFCGAIFIILYLIHDLTKLITKEQNKNIELIQEISILKKKVEDLEKQKKD